MICHPGRSILPDLLLISSVATGLRRQLHSSLASQTSRLTSLPCSLDVTPSFAGSHAALGSCRYGPALLLLLPVLHPSLHELLMSL